MTSLTSSKPVQGDKRSASARETLEQGMPKIAATCAIGTTIEYYDFTLYAIATALVFNRIFFPAHDPLVGVLLGFVTFFVGYCARPLGGIVFGHLGDRIGRKKSLLMTVIIMGVATVIVGLIPSYQSIGIWAPVTLVTLRFLQGIGIGGEYGGGMVMVVEHSPTRLRGFYSAFVHIGIPAGLLLPLFLLGVLNAFMSDTAFMSWGWRIPFLLTIVLLVLGVIIRMQISETPDFVAMRSRGDMEKLPLVTAIRGHWASILLGIGGRIAESGLFNIYAVFAIAYCVTQMKVPRQAVLNGMILASVLECFTLPFFGWLSDKVGRKAVFAGGMIYQAILAWPFFMLLNTGRPLWIGVALVLALTVGHASVSGPQGAFYSELFPPKVRYTALSLVQQIGPILGAGVSPLVATTILKQNWGWPVIALYMGAMAILAAVCAVFLRHSVHQFDYAEERV
ncbi:MHS family MFS transporter [Paraburkholderia sp. Ac-20342]|uniref:MFS transporter n=1 Tax=Paraburkholderia sp. Ac-20342 TaxID=2703889 RepID=UPI00197D6577|nr:MFS transporter [Paraburkholderia sp. Ac-20342]MBN3849328.1 MHS family MFS transporter [Paraburkholderia sp. Ac-20342]